MSGDNHPIHYDIEYCRRQGHPGLLAHGFQVLAQTAAGAGIFPHVVGESLIGFIEQSSRFLKPVYAGDTVYPPAHRHRAHARPEDRRHHRALDAAQSAGSSAWR